LSRAVDDGGERVDGDPPPGDGRRHPGRGALTFADTDSLNLNQPIAQFGSLAALNAAGAGQHAVGGEPDARPHDLVLHRHDQPRPPEAGAAVNNGDPLTFDNTLARRSRWMSRASRSRTTWQTPNANPSNVRFVAADYAAGGACGASACSLNQIRKMNITLTGRSHKPVDSHRPVLSQIPSRRR